MATRSVATDPSQDITACDREPIHIPGAIQPHGLLLVVDATTLTIVAGAGPIEERLAPEWLGQPLSTLAGEQVAEMVRAMPIGLGSAAAAAPIQGLTECFTVTAHRIAGDIVLIEMEAGAADTPWGAGSPLGWLDAAATSFERTGDLAMLCERAATTFRLLTGFDRVMLYRFLDEDSGRVVAEARTPELHSFLNHHFPASDIPKQARALYVRNRTRSIPDIDYVPAPLRPAGFETVDLSDVALRSVSPIHIRYLKNMGVAASASISIVKDGVLWGMIACHHYSSRRLSPDLRAAAAALASGLARQIRAKEEAEIYRERLRLRAAEDSILPRIIGLGDIVPAVRRLMPEMAAMMGASGFAVVEKGKVHVHGICPPPLAILDIAQWATARSGGELVATHELATLMPEAKSLAASAAGVMALPLVDGGVTLLWFRPEQVEEVEWAGNPHKSVALSPDEALTPRASFESWGETVRGRSRRWTLEEVESGHRLRRALHDASQNHRLRGLNTALQRTLDDKEALLIQKDVLMKEVDHRVQNSLQLVSSFLALQAKAAGDARVREQLTEAQARLSAVALVHRRLYRDDQIQTVDLARYLEDLVGDMKQSLGREWSTRMRLDLAPVLMPTDRAINLGLVTTELIINATKYAYDGAVGPVTITLEQYGNRLRLIVADEGRGRAVDGDAPGDGRGFGSRMMAAMMQRLSGSIEYDDNRPGLRAIVIAPIAD
ncbi:histidine kinase dimerization/phosphoacceptor domain -containing protein [Sphingomonas fuzhouensis]|uniref:histidine kinase dimerization/phosphoacceptor domain -containing protein n=1 Tax=Sphingomonas fuzhouensis TaxID=3106033 RepID=UPI002AFEA645|nr:histidine kinase dimerization/phosphoacceptor domain -containing protein [Sphingomonas sp. SGZ-02]